MLNHLRLRTLRLRYNIVSLSIVNHKRSEVTSIPIGTAIFVKVGTITSQIIFIRYLVVLL